MPTRAQMWQRLDSSVDLVIIGGGINGAGIARDAVKRGLSVALVERDDLASGTSSCSSKLVHGGLRYLEKYEFSLVFEAVSERRILMDIAPHLVNPLGFLFPVYSGDRHSAWLINAGMWLYDGLSLFRSPKLHRNLTMAEVAKEEPALSNVGLESAPLYYDCSTNDARLTLETALDAARLGAVVVTHASVVSLLSGADGRVNGVMVEDAETGERKEVQAGAVINATGPWTDITLNMSHSPPKNDLLRPTKGIHIVFPHKKLPLEHAIVLVHPDDDRVMFAIPWGDCTYAGTTDTDFDGDPGSVHASTQDVAYMIAVLNKYFPNHQLSGDDVQSTWAGLRPLVRPAVSENEDEVDESSVSREHRIIVGRDGLVSIAGGKLTTYRKMCEEVVDVAVNMLTLSGSIPHRLPHPNTDTEPLPGAVGWPANDDHDAVAAQVVEASGGLLTTKVARNLADTYGMKALDVAKLAASDPGLAKPIVEGRPELMAQVNWAVQREFANCVADVLARRTQIYYRDKEQGLDVADAVAHQMAPLLGWSPERARLSAEEYRQVVNVSRAWSNPSSSG